MRASAEKETAMAVPCYVHACSRGDTSIVVGLSRLPAEKERGGSSTQQVGQPGSEQMISYAYMHSVVVIKATEDVFECDTQAVIQNQSRTVPWRVYSMPLQESWIVPIAGNEP